MPFGGALTMGIVGGANVLGQFFGSKSQANAAREAARVQAEAAKYASDLTYKAQQEALAEQQRQFNIGQQNVAPWLETGKAGLGALQYGLGLGGEAGATGLGAGELMAPWTEQFQAPTVTDDPGYQFRLNEGIKALNASAAAKGGALSGGAVRQAMRFGQDMGSQEYQNAYNRALGEYQMGYNIFQQNQANRYNRLAALSGVGQTAAGQLGSLGQAYAGNVGNLLMGGAKTMGDLATQAGNARASGYMGVANAWSPFYSAMGGLPGTIYGLSQIFGKGNSGIPYINPATVPTIPPNFDW